MTGFAATARATRGEVEAGRNAVSPRRTDVGENADATGDNHAE